MRRDMNLVRKILLEAENLPGEGGYIDLPDSDDELLRYHLRIMRQAGLLDAAFAAHEGTAHETNYVNGLTWQGQEFLNAARDESRWKKGASLAGQAAGGIIYEVLRDYLMKEAKRNIGLPA